jgi:gas vesicle protein
MGKTTNALIGFISGAAVGAALGILFAPDKGRKTRKKISKKTKKFSSEISDNLNEQVDTLKQHINDFVDDVKEKFDGIDSELKEKVAKEKDRVAANVSGGNAKQAKK